MANPMMTFADVLHHLVDASRFDNETDGNLAHALIEAQYPAPVAPIVPPVPGA